MGCYRRWILAIGISVWLLFNYFYTKSVPDPRLKSTHSPSRDRYRHQWWKEYVPEYPVTSMIPLPTNAPVIIPPIQHKFEPEDHEATLQREKRRDAVRASFIHSWDGYKQNAWGRDEVGPVDGKMKDPYGGWGATLVDSLDTLWIMGLKDEFENAVRAVRHIDFSSSPTLTLNVFETTIRFVGGLLAAYDISGAAYPVLLHKAIEVGDLLYVAFDTQNRMPILRWFWPNSRDGKDLEPSNINILAELGSLSVEFTRLSQLTDDPKYYDAIQRITNLLEEHQDTTRLPGMWPLTVDALTPRFDTDRRFTFNGMSDSLYEYLPKQYLMLGGRTPQYRKMYEKAMDVAKQHMFFRPLTKDGDDILLSGLVHVLGKSTVQLQPETQHLTCFVGGMVAMGAKIFDRPGELEIGKKLTEGCIWAYRNTPTGIMPEIFRAYPCEDEESDCIWDPRIWFNIEENESPQELLDRAKEQGQVLMPGFQNIPSKSYHLRPEAIESVFILYRITGDTSLQDKGWDMFTAIEKHTKTNVSYGSIDDVTSSKPAVMNEMESFWTGETLKYFYLLFSEPDLLMESFDDVHYALNSPTNAISLGEPSGGHQSHVLQAAHLRRASSDSVTGNGKTAATVEAPSAPLEHALAREDRPGEAERLDASHDTFTTFPPHSSDEHRNSTGMLIFDDDGDGGDEEPNVAKSFERVSSPHDSSSRTRDGFDGDDGRDGTKGGKYAFSKMHKFSLYETSTRYYMVGMDLLDRRFRMLKIERTSGVEDLVVAEDETVYSKTEMNQLLDAVDDGNRVSGGLKLRCSTWGLLGFIRFTGSYYMLLVTKRSQVAMIGGHYVYQIDGTELVPLASAASAKLKSEKQADEARYIAIMNNVDMTRSFYFSYSYNISRTLQHNIAAERQALDQDTEKNGNQDHNSMFVWNDYLLNPVVSSFKNAYDWCLPIIHGYVAQSAISVYGRLVYITLIARRSRFFAGARYLKRGTNDLGHVANDVETEQIVSEMLTTSFHAPGPKFYSNPQYTSYVQHRGSIPLYWTQDSTGVAPRPDIELNLVDPFYSAAALHFNNLFERYGAPVYILNLIKAREKIPRESKLLKEYTNAVKYLNQFLPEDKKLIYRAWDMSRASKSRDQDVIGTLESIANDIIPKTGFFHNGQDADSGLRMQNGVARTNCIDCLDRTNAAQFVIAKRALGHQLHALGVIAQTYIDYDTDAINMFTNMWHNHGDTIAVQYGGSHLVNTMATYRKLNQWVATSRDMVESFKRYYNNSFIDAQRQEAYNLFLGNYVFSQDLPMLWELTTDYHLHHSNPREWSGFKKNNYINWFSEEFIKERAMLPAVSPSVMANKRIRDFDDYWLEYYRPRALSSFSKMFSFKLRSKIRDARLQGANLNESNLSPFVVRTDHEQDSQREWKSSQRKNMSINEPIMESNEDTESIDAGAAGTSYPPKPTPEWLLPVPFEGVNGHSSHSKGQQLYDLQADYELPNFHTSPPPKEGNKAQFAQWSLGQLVADSLNPSISTAEAEEYERYVNHPLKVPLVVTSDDPRSAALLAERGGGSNADLFEYANKCLLEDGDLDALADDNLADYIEFLNVGEEGLTVVGDDYYKKRYKRYRQWLRGKSLFKQSVDV
ncbi:phosphatidylinositol-3,5-bisphosphate 5-phosphatase [Myotisia sp. PD_48]|nr:phosphatidylinositol-3,5-bisphosphate 5-phosphatase [Myotisia sp. PD_48]